MGSKSTDAAGFAVFLSDNFNIKILCGRQFQNRIEDSVYALLKEQIERFGLQSRFRILETKIINRFTGSEFLFYGLWRNIAEVKSMQGIDILWLEEAHNLTEEQWDILENTIFRKAFAQVWIVFNPNLATDFVWRRFVISPPPGTLVRHINYDENPFLPPSAIALIERIKAEDHEKYEHIYLGVPRQNDEASIIKRTWILAAVDANRKLQIEPSGRKRIGFDIADSGLDKCAEVYAQGFHVSWADLWKASEDELLKSCTRTFHDARTREADVTYDSIGVGASAGAKFGELNKAHPGQRIQYAKFNAGGEIYKPEAVYAHGTKNKDMFSNLKAQTWWLVADRFRNTFNAVRNGHKFKDDEIISIASTTPFLTQLIDELATPKRDYDANGKVKVESKKDLAKREVPSPNLADAFVMAFAPTKPSMIMTDDYLGSLKAAVRR